MHDRLQTLRGFVRFLARRFGEEDLDQVASSLTFTTLLALVPLVTIVITVISAFPMFGGVVDSLRTFILANFVPGAASRLITVYMQQFADKASRLTTLGIGALAVTAIILMFTIERVFNRIWRVRRRRPLLQRIFVYWAALTIGPLLIGASLYATSWLISASLGLLQLGPAGGLLFRAGSILFTCLALAFLYRTVPNRPVALTDAAVGGVLAGLAFEAMKAGFTYFVTRFGSYKLVYGAFASLPVFLLWIYLSWIVVLAGAVVTASLPYLRSGGWKAAHRPGARFVEALQLLGTLRDAQRRGAVVPSNRLAVEARLALEDTENLLARLEARGWVARSGAEGWLIAHDLREVPVAKVYREFVFDAEAIGGTAAAPAIKVLLETLGKSIDESATMSVGEVLAHR